MVNTWLQLDNSGFADRRGRTTLIAKARWLLLILTCLYALGAATFYTFSSHGFVFSSLQITLISISVAAIFAYNLVYHFYYEALLQLKYVDHFQIFLDLLFVTILVFCSGGSASWLWALYLLVTLEASILFEEKKNVWVHGIFGTTLFGGLLLFGYNNLITHVEMPFVDLKIHHNPTYLWLKWFWVCLLNATVATAGSALMTVIRRERRALEKSEAEKVAFMESAHDLIFRCSPEGKFLYVNPAWEQTIGYNLEELKNMTMLDFLDGEYKTRCMVQFRRALQGDHVSAMEGKLVARNGIYISVEGSFTCTFKKGKPDSIWAICRDITARKEAQEQLHYLAHHDMLTDLPNRLTFTDRLNQAKAMARRQDKSLALLFLDLDRFKVVNDTLGHTIGDMMLQETANRLQSCVREVDTVSRFGGDEFAILLVNPGSRENIERISLNILNKLGLAMVLDGHELFITTSIGVSMFPEDSQDSDELIKKADIAMYQAKANGRNNCQFYQQEMDMHAQRRLVLENSLRKALENEEFYILYQPKLNLTSNQVNALEALLRWEHPVLGLIPPKDFIALAEDSGLIVPLGEWVLRQVCEQNLRWRKEGLPPVRIAVNLSGFQLERKNFVERVQAILRESGVDGSFLEFEITETVIMQNPDFAIKILNQLREMGIHISIDDFGTGYSSLAHLKRFSVNTLKIDKSFVDDVNISHTDAAIATAIIAMGKSLNLTVIAEGVETRGQLDFLKKENCNEMQGYLFSKPLPPGEIGALLREHNSGQTLANTGEWPTTSVPPKPT